jgi:hypothetical protein
LLQENNGGGGYQSSAKSASRGQGNFRGCGSGNGGCCGHGGRSYNGRGSGAPKQHAKAAATTTRPCVRYVRKAIMKL